MRIEKHLFPYIPSPQRQSYGIHEGSSENSEIPILRSRDAVGLGDIRGMEGGFPELFKKA